MHKHSLVLVFFFKMLVDLSGVKVVIKKKSGVKVRELGPFLVASPNSTQINKG